MYIRGLEGLQANEISKTLSYPWFIDKSLSYKNIFLSLYTQPSNELKYTKIKKNSNHTGSLIFDLKNSKSNNKFGIKKKKKYFYQTKSFTK